jgi:hypothetical protein
MRCRPSLELLEGRVVPSTDTFINLAGGSWSTATNWSLGHSPAQGDDVVIPALSGNSTVTIGLTAGGIINNLTLDSNLVLQGSLSLAGSVNGIGTILLSSGSLSGGTVSSGITIRASAPSESTLTNVTLAGQLSIYGGNLLTQTVVDINGLTLNQGTVFIGNGTSDGQVFFTGGSQTLGGVGTIVFNGVSNDSEMAINQGFPAQNHTLTIGAGISVIGGMGTLFATSGCNVMDLGSIQASGSNGQLTFQNVAIGPAGSLSLTNGASATTNLFGPNLTNAGNITIGFGSKLSVTGLFTQTSTGTLSIQIGSPPSSPQTPYLGSLNLAGTLSATYVNGFHPSSGQSFLIASGSRTGTFQTVLGGIASYQATSVFLNISSSTLQPNVLHWDSAQGGVDVGYQVSNGVVPVNTQLTLYWSTSNQFAGAIGGPAYSRNIVAGTANGSYGPFIVPISSLTAPPAGADYLLAVTDPNNVLGDFDPANSVLALAYSPDVTVDSVSTGDSRTLTVTYNVSGSNAATPLTIDFYRSATPTFNLTLNAPLGYVTDNDPAIGSYTDTFTVPGGLTPDPVLPYVLAVAATPGSTSPPATGASTVSFRTYVIAAVSPGFNPTSRTDQGPPVTWVQQMVTSLVVNDGYYAVDPVTWASGLWSSSAISDAQQNLANWLQAEATSIPNLQHNDVIDIHLIGHSRGAALVDEALETLLGNTGVIPQLAHGYMKLTLLDPHPANNHYGFNASVSGVAQNLKMTSYMEFQQTVQDPALMIPSRVNEVDDVYERTQASALPFFSFESSLNPHGLSPADLGVVSTTMTTVLSYDLTPLSSGHSDVEAWYESHVVDNRSLASSSTPSGFGPPPTSDVSLIIPPVTVASLTATGLQAFINASGTPTIPINSASQLNVVASIINSLPPQATPTTITLDLGTLPIPPSVYLYLIRPHLGITVLVIDETSSPVVIDGLWPATAEVLV